MGNKGVEIKGSSEGITVYLKEDVEFEELKISLIEVFRRRKNFFGNAVVEINVGRRDCSLKQLEEITDIVDEHSNIFLKKIYNSKGKILVDFTRERFNLSKARESLSKDGQKIGETLILKKTIRSGQSIKFNGHIVILGDINPGAEVVAGGDIIVMGTIRGVVHAGIAGDKNASITALKLLPTQLRIADVICRSPDEEMSVPDVPEFAFINDERIFINPLIKKKE